MKHNTNTKLGRLRIYRAFEVYFGARDYEAVPSYLGMDEPLVSKNGFCAAAYDMGTSLSSLPELLEQKPREVLIGGWWFMNPFGPDIPRVNASIAAQRLCMKHLSTNQLHLLLRLDTNQLSYEAIRNEIDGRGRGCNARLTIQKQNE